MKRSDTSSCPGDRQIPVQDFTVCSAVNCNALYFKPLQILILFILNNIFCKILIHRWGQKRPRYRTIPEKHFPARSFDGFSLRHSAERDHQSVSCFRLSTYLSILWSSRGIRICCGQRGMHCSQLIQWSACLTVGMDLSYSSRYFLRARA